MRAHRWRGVTRARTVRTTTRTRRTAGTGPGQAGLQGQRARAAACRGLHLRAPRRRRVRLHRVRDRRVRRADRRVGMLPIEGDRVRGEGDPPGRCPAGPARPPDQRGGHSPQRRRIAVHLLRFAQTLMLAGLTGSVGSVGDAYDNALAETTIGLCKPNVCGPGRRSATAPSAPWPAWRRPPAHGCTGTTPKGSCTAWDASPPPKPKPGTGPGRNTWLDMGPPRRAATPRPAADQRSGPAPGKATALRPMSSHLPLETGNQVTSPQQPPPGATAHTKPGVHETRDAPAFAWISRSSWSQWPNESGGSGRPGSSLRWPGRARRG